MVGQFNFLTDILSQRNYILYYYPYNYIITLCLKLCIVVGEFNFPIDILSQRNYFINEKDFILNFVYPMFEAGYRTRVSDVREILMGDPGASGHP